jgi:hypothetical protein
LRLQETRTANLLPVKHHEFFATQQILEHESAAPKETVKPQDPISGAFSGRHIRKFERAVSMPTLVTSSHDLQAHGGNDDGRVDSGFDTCGQSISEHG